MTTFTWDFENSQAALAALEREIGRLTMRREGMNKALDVKATESDLNGFVRSTGITDFAIVGQNIDTNPGNCKVFNGPIESNSLVERGHDLLNQDFVNYIHHCVDELLKYGGDLNLVGIGGKPRDIKKNDVFKATANGVSVRFEFECPTTQIQIEGGGCNQDVKSSGEINRR